MVTPGTKPKRTAAKAPKVVKGEDEVTSPERGNKKTAKLVEEEDEEEPYVSPKRGKKQSPKSKNELHHPMVAKTAPPSQAVPQSVGAHVPLPPPTPTDPASSEPSWLFAFLEAQQKRDELWREEQREERERDKREKLEKEAREKELQRRRREEQLQGE